MVQVDHNGPRKLYARYRVDTRGGYPDFGAKSLKSAVTDPMWNPAALQLLLEQVDAAVGKSEEHADHSGLRDTRITALQQALNVLHAKLQ